MAKTAKTIPQPYPRIAEYGYLDEAALVAHTQKLPVELLKELIREAIHYANSKSSREILSLPAGATEAEMAAIYDRKGRESFKYFKKYCGDPASTAHQVFGKHYREVGIEQFHNQTLQKERMNSGWRYQYLAFKCARHAGRFDEVSDLSAAEADFCAKIRFRDQAQGWLNLYVSVKNRSNTTSGTKWPKDIPALEAIARDDKNRSGPYCCVFGIAMEHGARSIKRDNKSKRAYSENTELWRSDFFWPFFANYSYEEIMTCVLEVLLSSAPATDLPTQVEVPEPLLESFGACCRRAQLVNEEGKFNDPRRLVQFFCRK